MGFLRDIVKLPGKLISGITGETGADAAQQAARIQGPAIKEAAGIEAEAIRSILPLLQEQMGLTKERFAPFVEAGAAALPEFQRGTTAGGLDEILTQIMGGEAFQGLREQRTRDVQGMLGAGGLTRSGEAISAGADISADLALQLQNILSQGQQSLISGGRAAAAGEAGETGNITQQIINAITGAAGAEAGGVRQAAGATASGILGGAQAQAQGLQNLLNIGGTLGSAAILSSDPRLKENVRNLGKIGPLDLVEWDWVPELEGDFFKDAPKIGFMSTQVAEHYPEFVEEFGGYDAVNYPDLLNKLEEDGEKWH